MSESTDQPEYGPLELVAKLTDVEPVEVHNIAHALQDPFTVMADLRRGRNYIAWGPVDYDDPGVEAVDVRNVRTDGGHDRTILACPECDSPGIRRRISAIGNPDEPDWRCSACTAQFNDPTRRASRGSGHTVSGHALTLEKMDADDLATDGGQAAHPGLAVEPSADLTSADLHWRARYIVGGLEHTSEWSPDFDLIQWIVHELRQYEEINQISIERREVIRS